MSLGSYDSVDIELSKLELRFYFWSAYFSSTSIFLFSVFVSTLQIRPSMGLPMLAIVHSSCFRILSAAVLLRCKDVFEACDRLIPHGLLTAYCLGCMCINGSPYWSL